MEKPGKKHPKKKNLKKWLASSLKNSLWNSFQFLLAYQLPLFSVRGTSTPNELFQAIDGLNKNINGLHQTTPSTIT